MGTHREFTLICFAVRSESQILRKLRPDLPIIHTGMGKENTSRSLRAFLQAEGPPSRIISSGFAGGLNPQLKTGTVVMEGTDETLADAAEKNSEIYRGRFLCADRIAVTSSEKQELWRRTHHDAIEMESEIVHEFADNHDIPCTTLRVISDPSDIDLPLDFNELTTADMRMNYLKLMGRLMRNPSKIPKLMQFNQAIQQSAKILAKTLSSLLPRSVD